MNSVNRSNLPEDAKSLLKILDCEEWASSLSEDEIETIWQAYLLARETHAEQKPKLGQPYVMDLVSVASILAKYHLDVEAIATALLHETMENEPSLKNVIRNGFSSSIATLVDEVNELKGIRYSDEVQDAQKIRKYYIATVSDVRVVLIKLADQLHKMRTLHALPRQKQIQIAHETMEIFAPLAEQLGIGDMKGQLEDYSFRYLNPEAYAKMVTEMRTRQEERREIVNKIIERIRMRLIKDTHLKPDEFVVSGRSKNIYSIYKKMQTPKYEGKGVERIYDKLGIRIIVNTIPDCYMVLGLVHSEWRPVPGEFDDYIGMVLPSGYQSLHTAIRSGSKKDDVVEFQIRTQEMHYEAEYGVAAHWLYKEKTKRDTSLEKKIARLRRMMESPQESEDAQTFVEVLKSDVFPDRVYVLTPKGKIIELPAGATPIDFAYQIHTEVGDRCRGAKVNGKMVPLSYQLQSRDQVEILTVKRSRPSRDWLNPYLGYVKTARAKAKIRSWFRKQAREENIRQGREMMERELRQLGLKASLSELAEKNNFDKLDDFFAQIGAGDLSPHSIAVKELEARREEETSLGIEAEIAAFQEKVSASPKNKSNDSGIIVRGVGDLMTRMAGCCNPVPGEQIVGYVTRGHGLSVHRRRCPNILNKINPERIVELDWGTPQTLFPVTLKILALDRDGLLRDIVDVVANEKVSIASVNVVTDKTDNSAIITATLEVSNAKQLSRILSRINGLPNVIEAHRATN